MADETCTLRPMSCELNHLSVPDGSTMFMQGDTSVIAGIYGPIEARIQKVQHTKASVQATFGPIKGPPSVDDRLMELYLRDTCEAAIITSLHPASAITINIQELQDCGGLLACCINASCLALLNSGISMKFTIAAVHCMIEKETNKIVTDPNKTQLANAKATFTCAFDSSNKDLICCQTSGCFSEDDFSNVVNKCKDASEHVFKFYRDIVTQYATAI